MRLAAGFHISEVDSLPGCSQIAVSHSAFVPKDYRNNGLGSEGHVAKLNILQDYYLYDVVVCTVDMKNVPERKILKRNGWKFLFSFTSSKTGHKVGMYVHSLSSKISEIESQINEPEFQPAEKYYEDYIHKDGDSILC